MKAWEWLEQHEWVQGELLKAEDSIGVIGACALGAIRIAYGIEQGYYDATDLLFGEILTRTDFSSIMAWNDAPSRTKEEVIALFKELDI